MIKRIILAGEGGQGINLASHILGNILSNLGYEITITYDYDTAVRGGKMTAYITYSDKKIGNPLVEEPDVLIKTSNSNLEVAAKKTIIDAKFKTEKNEEAAAFLKTAEEKFGNKIVTGMLILGKLLKILEIDIKKIDLKKVLPAKFLETNTEAINYGYTQKF